jgi:hypothetical protein
MLRVLMWAGFKTNPAHPSSCQFFRDLLQVISSMIIENTYPSS